MSEETKILYGACRFCGQTQTVNEDEVLDIIRHTGVDGEEAKNIAATRYCDCEQAKAAATHEMKLQAAGEWAKGVFEKDPEKLQCVLCAIKATSEHHFGRISIKSGKYLYTFDVDAAGDIRIKTKYTDTQEETF